VHFHTKKTLPFVLMHCGIFQIDVVVDLPVGKLFQDHQKSDIVFTTNRKPLDLTLEHFWEYAMNGTGNALIVTQM